MIEGFNISKIENIELSLKVTSDEAKGFHQAPTDSTIKEYLKEMLTETMKHFENAEDGIENFDISEKYSTTATLKASIEDTELYQDVHDIRDESALVLQSDAIQNPQHIPYYRVKFYDDQNNEIVGVRTASYFKAILKQRNRVMKLVDDTLKPCEDTLFKLDNDFDFIIAKNDVYVYRPRNFEIIANLDEELLAVAALRVEVLASSLDFVDFNKIKTITKTSKKAAKLVLSLSGRPDLKYISQENITKNANETGLKLERNDNEQMVPAEGEEVDFLEMLDRRRYSVVLVDGSREVYRASRRKPVKPKQTESTT
ncbi:DUF4868 domain-containing protein [Vibrio alginolyticus]|nr:DUF4868 domain-containing protein [Vibrio alginolyticus]ELB2871658.1 DUF4868 domain-containing protein [Vibrio alginolyticus]